MDNHPNEHGWARVKERLRGEVGEPVYNSWFTRMELQSVEGATVRISVPTRFLKSWIQSHYTDRVVACWQAENPDVGSANLFLTQAEELHVVVLEIYFELKCPAFLDFGAVKVAISFDCGSHLRRQVRRNL